MPKRRNAHYLHSSVNLRHCRPMYHVPLSMSKISRSRSFSTSTTQVKNKNIQNRTKKVSSPKSGFFHNFVGGPALNLDHGCGTDKALANHAYASLVASSGSTVVLTTVATSADQQQQQIEPRSNEDTTINNTWLPLDNVLTVEFRQRHHAVGHIPTANRYRKDNTVLTQEEVLASRALDRSLRPLLRLDSTSHLDRDSSVFDGTRYHVHSSVQACDVWSSLARTASSKNTSSNDLAPSASGDSLALAINSASAALQLGQQSQTNRPGVFREPVAATFLSILRDGTIVQDADMHLRRHPDLLGHLLYTGTRHCVVMMEWEAAATPIMSASSSFDSLSDVTDSRIGLADAQWADLLKIAHESIQPILDEIDSFCQRRRAAIDSELSLGNDERVLRESLGLPPLKGVDDSSFGAIRVSEPVGSAEMASLTDEVSDVCQSELEESLLYLFGRRINSAKAARVPDGAVVQLHSGSELHSKKFRGRREHLMQEEVKRIVQEYLEQKREPSMTALSPWITRAVVAKIFRWALSTASALGYRSDGRGSDGIGCGTIRPLHLQVPALPDSVHGSALFSRGDTQVLCTVTLGPPRDGISLLDDPYNPIEDPGAPREQSKEKLSGYESLPVGSLRFLRTQEAMVSDQNTRKIQAAREPTGSSGSLAETKRAFLQYDFPPYSTGTVPIGSVAHNRRAIGHGALAERALLPVLPPPNQFPYAIRMTSEVTDSNGSSSMASVCGISLALLDAGIPILEPVAGVSVGLAKEIDDSKYSLLLDITGTEDHYGGFDFKIAGTRHGVTALQLDVKEPIADSIVLEALCLASVGRAKILDEMESLTAESLGGLVPRLELKKSAPAVEVVRFDPQRKRDLVGPGGIVLRQMEDRYGVSLDLTQEGQCLIFGANREMVSNARATVMDLVADVLPGEVYTVSCRVFTSEALPPSKSYLRMRVRLDRVPSWKSKTMALS